MDLKSLLIILVYCLISCSISHVHFVYFCQVHFRLVLHQSIISSWSCEILLILYNLQKLIKFEVTHTLNIQDDIVYSRSFYNDIVYSLSFYNLYLHIVYSECQAAVSAVSELNVPNQSIIPKWSIYGLRWMLNDGVECWNFQLEYNFSTDFILIPTLSYSHSTESHTTIMLFQIVSKISFILFALLYCR